MDKYLLEQFITRIENDNASDFIKYLILNSKEIKDNGSKRYLNYYPQQEKGIQLVIEATKDKKGKLNVDDFMFHHKSKQTWELEVVTPMKTFKGTYLVNQKDKGAICLRLIDEELLDNKLKAKSKFKAQVCGIVMLADFYSNEEEYRNSIKPDEKGNKTIMSDGYLIPHNLIVNNDAKLTEKERENRNHARDNLLTFKSPLKNVKQIEISMLNLELPCYYSATIDTTYGELEIIIPRKIVSTYGKKLKDGLIIKGELLLSGSVINKKTK